MEPSTTVGWYPDRATTHTLIDKGLMRSAFGGRIDTVRAEAFENFVVLTHPAEPAFAGHTDYYLD